MEQNINNKVAIKIGLLGDADVGKTSICNTYIGIEFTYDTLTTIGVDRFERRITLKNEEEVKLIIWDTAGQERFRSAAYKAIRAVQGIILVFDFTRRNTFNNIENYLKDIKENFNNPVIVLFGNKADIEANHKEVSREEVEQYVKEKNLIYFETSAKTGRGIDEGFSYIANEIYEKFSSNNTKSIQINKNEIYYTKDCFGKKKKIRRKNYSE